MTSNQGLEEVKSIVDQINRAIRTGDFKKAHSLADGIPHEGIRAQVHHRLEILEFNESVRGMTKAEARKQANEARIRAQRALVKYLTFAMRLNALQRRGEESSGENWEREKALLGEWSDAWDRQIWLEEIA